MRRASCRSVPMMCRPPSSLDRLALGLHASRAARSRVTSCVPFVLRHVEPRGVFVLQLGPGHRLGIAAEDDVGAAAGHVRGDGHGALAAGLGDDLGLALVVLGVEHLVLDAALVEQAARAARSFRSRRCRPGSAGPAAGSRLILSRGIDFASACVFGSCNSIDVVVLACGSCRRSYVAVLQLDASSQRLSRSISSAMALNFSRSLR